MDTTMFWRAEAMGLHEEDADPLRSEVTRLQDLLLVASKAKAAVDPSQAIPPIRFETDGPVRPPGQRAPREQTDPRVTLVASLLELAVDAETRAPPISPLPWLRRAREEIETWERHARGQREPIKVPLIGPAKRM